jgi:hypothetical protein
VLPSPADRELVFWKTSNKIFRLGLERFPGELRTISRFEFV